MAMLGGLGGIFCLEELERGAAGVMTGLSFPEVLVGVHERFSSSDREGATAVFYRTMPLIRYEFQNKIVLAFRKHVLEVGDLRERPHRTESRA